MIGSRSSFSLLPLIDGPQPIWFWKSTIRKATGWVICKQFITQSQGNTHRVKGTGTSVLEQVRMAMLTIWDSSVFICHTECQCLRSELEHIWPTSHPSHRSQTTQVRSILAWVTSLSAQEPAPQNAEDALDPIYASSASALTSPQEQELVIATCKLPNWQKMADVLRNAPLDTFSQSWRPFQNLDAFFALCCKTN